MCRRILAALFPLSLAAADDRRYRTAAEADPTYIANTAGLTAALRLLPRDSADLIHAQAKEHLAAERARQESILSRGQGLLVAQAFLSALLSLGGAALGHLGMFAGWRGAALAGLAFYLVIQTVLLTVSALRAIGGLGYPAVGSSELREIMQAAGGADDIVRELALRTLLNYRTATILNTWRFLHLSNAQKCLRNSAIAFALLVLALFAISLVPPAGLTPGASPGGRIVRVPPPPTGHG